jgi:hypothetical protein
LPFPLSEMNPAHVDIVLHLATVSEPPLGHNVPYAYCDSWRTRSATAAQEAPVWRGPKSSAAAERD